MSHDCLEVCHAVVLGQISQVCPGHVFCFLPSGYYLVWFEKEIINLSNEDFVSVYFAAFLKEHYNIYLLSEIKMDDSTATMSV